MPIAQILAPLTGSATDAAVLAYSLAAAKPFNAHVLAVFVRPDLTEALALFNEGMSGVVVDEVVKASRDATDEALKRIENLIASVATASSAQRVDRPQRGQNVTISLREVQGDFGDQLTELARLSDLVVFAPFRDSSHSGKAEAFVQVLVQTDRPVLLCSETPSNTFARRVVIGWDGKTQAAQAVRAALPYLALAESVEIISVQRTPADLGAIEGLKEYLQLHGVKSSERIVNPSSKSIGEVLLESAVASGADLLVVGGYGHSRLRESLVGGVTRHVISHATLPVFMVH